MADMMEKKEAVDLSAVADSGVLSDQSLESPIEAAPEPKPDEPKEESGWNAYWVSETGIVVNEDLPES